MNDNIPKLTPRLTLIASFVRGGSRVADIGTDHAYLPVWLVNSGVSPNAVASDINEGPLERARLTASEYNASDKINFCLADGLDGVNSQQAEDIIIAGMGGELIAKIISNCDWIKDKSKHLILQPMTAQEELHKYLCENGFKIIKEDVACEKCGRKLYIVMSVAYSGIKQKYDSLSLICGTLPKTGGKYARAYLEHNASVLLKRAKGLRNAKVLDTENAEKFEMLAKNILRVSSKMP